MGLYQKYVFRLILVLVVILSMWFVMAATDPSPYFEQNSTSNYDKEGTFSVNWTEGGDPAIDYVIYYKIDGGSYVTDANDSNFGYSFSNTTEGNYTFIIEGENATNVKTNSSEVWMIVDTTAPIISYTSNADSAGGGANRAWIFVNVSASDANNDTIIFSLYNSTDLVNQTSYSDSYATLTINWTGLTKEKVYYFNVTANDSATNSNSTATRTFYLDGTVPIAIVSCSQTTVYSGSSFPCTCSGTDATSGVSTETGSSTSPDGTSTPTSTGIFTYTCTVTDIAGNSASATATYTVSSRVVRGPLISQPPRKSHSWTLITPGVVAIMKNFDAEFGVREIIINVNNPAQNVKITVTKHDGKPAEVSVEKSGKVYQYLQIGAENFDNTLEKATVEFRAEKSWATSVELGKNDIAVSRYNEAENRWDELTTTSTGEDVTYYYYEVELDEFSYFAISEKSVVSEEELVLGLEKSKTWLWILVAVAIIAIIVGRMKIKKK
jgi:PGF-pre-PGF domain-containing protein